MEIIEKEVELRKDLAVEIAVGFDAGSRKPSWHFSLWNPQERFVDFIRGDLFIENEWIRRSSGIQIGKVTVWLLKVLKRTTRPEITQKETVSVLTQVIAMSDDLEAQSK